MVNRRTKLTKELISEFCELVEEGVPADTVCDYFGITNSTYWLWLKKGAVYLESDDDSKETRKLKIYGKFAQEFRKAVAQYKIGMVKKLHSGKGNNWVRDLAILERRDPDTFSRNNTSQGNADHYDSDDSFL